MLLHSWGAHINSSTLLWIPHDSESLQNFVLPKHNDIRNFLARKESCDIVEKDKYEKATDKEDANH